MPTQRVLEYQRKLPNMLERVSFGFYRESRLGLKTRRTLNLLQLQARLDSRVC